MAENTGKPYRDGELEVILSLSPTDQNIKHLSKLLGRTPSAIKIVYKIAFEHGPFGKDAGVQAKKILAAKKKLGITIGRTKPRA